MADDTSSVPPYEANTTNPQVSSDGQLIKRRAISTAAQAARIGDRLVLDDVGRDKRRAEIQRALNGQSPYSERALKEKNQGHRFNVSVGYLEGACGRAIAPYLDMGLDEEFVARLNADLEETKKNIIRDAFVKAVRRWGMWATNYNDLAAETVNFGYCTAIFPNPTSPWWHPVKQRDGLTFVRSRNITSKLDVFCWKRHYLIHELYDHVADEQAATIAGWNVENVYSALQYAAPDDYIKNRLMGGRQIYEEAIRAAALAISYGTGAKTIETYHVFCQELSGRVSHWIVLNTSSTTRAPEQDPEPGIHLFYQFEQFASMEEVVTRFDMEHGDGFWHGSKGLAQKLYSIHKAHDRLINSGLDQTFRGGLGVLKAGSEKALQAEGMVVNSDFVLLPPDCEMMPGVKMPTLDPTFFSMDAALLATAVQRGGDVAPEAMGIERSAKTATQSSLDNVNKQIVTKANLKRWVSPLGKVIDQMLRRLLNEQSGDPDAIRFCADLRTAGITPEDITKIKRVEVFHSVEDVFGETKQNVSYIADKYRNDPDADRMDIKKREVGIWLGPQASLELIPGDSDQLSQLHASRLQTMEISAILDGNAIPVAPDDLHPVHVQTIAAEFAHVADLMASGQTSTKRKIGDQDIVNLNAHAQDHIKAQASIKCQRDSARMMEQTMEQALQKLVQAKQIVQQRHAQALQQGIEAGLRDGSAPQGQSPTSPGMTPTSPSQAAPTPPGVVPTKVIESIKMPDLPDKGKAQMAQLAGLNLTEQDFADQTAREAAQSQTADQGVLTS